MLTFVQRFITSDLFKKSSKFVLASLGEEHILSWTDTYGDVLSRSLEAANCIKREGS